MLKLFTRDRNSTKQSSQVKQVYRERVAVVMKKQNTSAGFSFNWIIGSTVFYLMMQVALGILAKLFVLPFIVAGFTRFLTDGLILMAGFYIGSFILGVVSPGRRTLEPTLGAILAVIAAFSVSNFTPQMGGWFRLDGIAAAGTATMLAGILAYAGARSGEKLMGNIK